MLSKIGEFLSAVGVLIGALCAAAAAGIGVLCLIIFNAVVRALPFVIAVAVCFWLAKYFGVI